jgi:hypothetical protein
MPKGDAPLPPSYKATTPRANAALRASCQEIDAGVNAA